MAERKLYNEELKKRFLNQYKETTTIFYETVLVNCYESEKFYNKDISNFTHEEYANFLKGLKAKSLSSLTSKNSVVVKYIDFAIEQGYVATRLNVARNFDRETLRNYIRKDALENKYIETDELNDIVEKCVNAQDAVIFQLLREGAKGESLEELINLTPKDVDEVNQKLTLRSNDGSTRVIDVSQKTIDLIKEAEKQEYYYSNNGESDNNKTKGFYLSNTGYVIKTAGRKRLGKTSKQNIQRKVKLIAKWWGNPFLTVTNVWTSGQIEYARKLKSKYNIETLDTEHYKEICRRFGINENQWHRVKTDIEAYV